MIKTLARQVGQYKTAAILTPLFTSLEVVMDVLIPWVTAMLIDRGINAGNIGNVYLYGGIMLGMAFLSLLFGILAGRYSAYASTGFARNLRQAMYRNIQTFSFADIDKFSTSGLVTRMTTDVSNLQNAFQQLMRVSVRAPFRMIFSIFMCFVIDARLSIIFIVAMLVLGTFLYFLISRVSKLFSQVFVQYDQLNAQVQENVTGIRVVKAFVREDHEKSLFDRAAEGLYKLYVRTEGLMALNHPVMNLVVYGWAATSRTETRFKAIFFFIADSLEITEDATARFQRVCHIPHNRCPNDRRGRRRQATSAPPLRSKPPEDRAVQ